MKFLSQINVNTEYTLPIVDGANGQVLATDGNGTAYWGSISAGATNLNALTDVVISSPSTGQLLRYGIPVGSEDPNPVWYNWSHNFLTTGSSIDALGDVTISTATAGQILQYNGTAWVNTTLSTVEYVSKVQHLVKAGVAITKGQAVYVTGSDGTNMIVGLASNTSEGTSSKVMGLAASTAAINGQIFVVTEGLLAGLNTSTATAGDPVWLGANGNLIFGLLGKPTSPLHLVYIGVVTRVQQNNGEIFVKVQNGIEIDEIHDVQISSPATGQLLRRDTDGYWKNWTPNFLTAEADTLATVTGRGASTSTALSLGGGFNVPDNITNYISRFQTNDYTTMHFFSRAWQSVQGANGLAYNFTTHTNDGNGGYGALQIYYGESGYVYAPTSFRAPSFSSTALFITNADTSGSLQPEQGDPANKIYSFRWQGNEQGYIDTNARITFAGFKTPTGTASQFLKANGTVDSNTYVTSTALNAYATIDYVDDEIAGVNTYIGNNFVPNTRTLTINGTAFDLSANRSWTISTAETDTLATVTGRGNSTTNAITVGGATINGTWQTVISTGGGWNKLSFVASNAWGDGTTYGVLGAGGGAEPGVMTYNQHATWVGSSNGAGIRMGRSGGVAGGAWYQVATMDSDEFMIAKNGQWSNGGIKITSGGELQHGSSGNKYWHAGNDGSGSGLDADLIDGIDSSSILWGNAKGTNDSVTTDADGLDKTGFYTSSAFVTRPDGVDNWMYIQHIKLYSANSQYQKQIGYDTYDDRMWVRTKSANTWSTWKAILTSDNIGEYALTSLPAHTHTIANVTGLQTALDGKASSSHTHGAGDITSGTLSADRLPKQELGISIAGNFGQWQLHSAYTNFNTAVNYWGWNYVQGNTNAPHQTSSQWYRGRFSLGNEYGFGNDPGDYWMEIAIPRYNQDSTAGNLFVRTAENGGINAWQGVRAAYATVSSYVSNGTSTLAGVTFGNTMLSNQSAGRVLNFDGNGAMPSVWWTSGATPIAAIDAISGGGLSFWANNGSSWWQQVSMTYGAFNVLTSLQQNGNAVIHAGNIGSQSVSYANSAGQAGFVTNQSGQLLRFDNRIIAPNETNAAYMQFGFTSWSNNNTAPWADYLHFRSYEDGSGGSDNLVMFKKDGIGMRIWQQAFGSASAYSSFVDVWTTGNFTQTNVNNWNTAYGWGNHASYGYWVLDNTEPKNVQAAEVIFAGNVTVEGTFTESSSIRFKENITPLDPALDKVNQLEAVSYNKIGVDDREIGLIAEDVAELFPEVVTYNEEGQTQGIQYQRLSVILLKAVQELSQEVNELKKKLN